MNARRTTMILFLDFDGVLNSSRFLRAQQDAGRPTRTTIERIDPAAVAQLNRIVATIDPIVVVSSTWREKHSLDALTDCLRVHGYIGRLYGATPVYGTSRGAEIQTWMTRKGIVPSEIVILDDNDDMDHLLPRLVLTDIDTGLLPEHVELVMKKTAKEPA